MFVLDNFNKLCYYQYSSKREILGYLVLVKHFIGVIKQYKDYQKTLKALKENTYNGDECLSQEDWAKLYAQEYGKYVRWMNTPLSDILK